MFLLRRIPALIAVLMLGALSLRLGMAHWAALFLTSVLLALLFVPRAIPQVAAPCRTVDRVPCLGGHGLAAGERASRPGPALAPPGVHLRRGDSLHGLGGLAAPQDEVMIHPQVHVA